MKFVGSSVREVRTANLRTDEPNEPYEPDEPTNLTNPTSSTNRTYGRKMYHRFRTMVKNNPLRASLPDWKPKTPGLKVPY